MAQYLAHVARNPYSVIAIQKAWLQPGGDVESGGIFSDVMAVVALLSTTAKTNIAPFNAN